MASRDDAVALARRRFLACERVDMGALATKLGINRATLYRWVGSKDLLLGEVISAVARETVAAARAESGGRGADHVARVVQRVIEQIHVFAPMRAFLERDPEYALRILTSAQSTVQRQSVQAIDELLADEVAAGHLELAPDLSTEDLAYVLVRIGESFLYSDVITGTELDVAKAGTVLRLLLRP